MHTNRQARKIHLDILRSLAIILVLYNHLPGYSYFFTGMGDVNSISDYLYVLSVMITRINVPIFFMISGALLLGKVESYYTVIHKRVFRFGFVLIVFSLLFFIWRGFLFGEISLVSASDFSIAFLRRLLSGDINFSYWFLYAYIAFLLFLPMVRYIANSLTHQDFLLLILFHFIFLTVIPIINLMCRAYGVSQIGINGNFVPFFSIYASFFYPIIGYYLENKLDLSKITRKSIAISFVAVFLGMLITYYAVITDGNLCGQRNESQIQLFDYLTAMVFYVYCKLLCSKIKLDSYPRFVYCLIFFSSLSFGIYLLDLFIKAPFEKFNLWFVFSANPLILSIEWIGFSVLVGGGLLILSRGYLLWVDISKCDIFKQRYFVLCRR